MSMLRMGKPLVHPPFTQSQYQQLLAIEWRPSGAAVSALVRQRDTWKLAYELDFKWTDEAIAADASRRAQELIRFIESKNLTGKPDTTAITFAIDPALVISKRLELPLLPESTVFDAVALELESRALGRDEYVSDYVVHRIPDHKGLLISTISAPMELIESIKQVAAAVGCTLHGIGLGEFGFAGLTDDTTPSVAASTGRTPELHVLADRLFMQLILSKDKRPVAEFRFPYPNNPTIIPKLVAASLEGLVQTLPPAIRCDASTPLIVLGERSQDVVAALKPSDFSVTELRLPNAPGRNWRAWGSVQQLLSSRDSFDLHRPKRGVDHRAVKRSKQLRLGLWAALMLAILGYSLVQYSRQLDHQVSALQVELQRLQSTSDQDRPTIDAATQLAQWERLPLHLSKQLPLVLKQLPSHDRVFLSSLQVDQGDDEQAEIKVEGLARQLDDALEVPQRLIQSGFELQPHRIDHNESDPHYRTRFTVTAKLVSDTEEQAQELETGEMHLTSQETR